MNKPISRPLLMAFGVMALIVMAALLLTPTAATDELPPTSAVDQAEGTVPAEGCQLLQTLSYTRCHHTVVRRVAAPVELYGLPLADAEALYPEWRITEFSPALVKMERQPDLFCPDHKVLMPNGAGYLCVYENKYGDSMALVREMSVQVKDLPAAAQEEVEFGLGFSTAAELEAWLESVES